MKVLFCLLSLVLAAPSFASDLKVGDSALLFSAKTDAGKDFSLESQKGHWTVLYFYPKSGTPGCTKQACTLRDNITKIRAVGAEVFGISANTVEDQAKFVKEHHLNFTLLADPDLAVIKLYNAKMPVLSMAKRWTYILDPELKIRKIQKDVDPVADSENVAKDIAALKAH